MEFEYEEFIYKFNPFFKNYHNSEKKAVVFFMFGKGDVRYYDNKGDGWKGDSTIYGIEIASIAKGFSGGLGLKVRDINFDKGTIPLINNKKYSATSILLYFSFAGGFGI